MKALVIVLAVLAVLLLLLLLPVHLEVDCLGRQLDAFVQVGPLKYHLLAGKKKKSGKKAAEKAEKKQKKKAKDEAQKKGMEKIEAVYAAGEEYLSLVKQITGLIPVIRRVLVIDNLTVYVRFYDEDPAQMAMHYGQAWAAIGWIVGILSNLFRLRKQDVCPVIDDTADGFVFEAKVRIHITLLGALRVLARFVSGREKTQKPLKTADAASSAPNENKE